MWITKLELLNIKSYESSGVVPFVRGVNAISGPNGAGKSTLLEAIGFALFDALPYTQTQFLREGEKSGEVVVSFIDVLDEREYQVVRTVGTSSIFVFDPEINAKVVSGKSDVVAWLKEHLGVDSSADLTALFEDSIGVPQGLLTAAFLERPASRKAQFDPLLQVDEYEEAWIQLREVARLLSEETQELRRKIAELTGEIKQLPDLKLELANLTAEIESRQKTLTELQSQLEELEREQSALDDEKTRLQELESAVDSLEARLQAAGAQVQDARSAVADAEKASEQVEAARGAHKAYVQAEEELAKLEQQRSTRDQLQARKNELDKEIALNRQRLEGLAASLAEIQTLEEQIKKLRPSITDQEELTERFELAQKRVAELEAQRSLIEDHESRLASLQAELAEMHTAVEKRAGLREEYEALRAKLQSLEVEAARLKADRTSIQAELEKIKQHRSTLDESHEADCPVCHQPLDAAHRKQLLEEYAHQDSELNRRTEEIDEQIETVELALARNRADAERVEAELVDLPDQKQLTALKSEQQAVEAKLSDRRDLVDELPQHKKTLDQTRRALDELGDPKGKLRVMTAQLESLEKLKQEQSDQRAMLLKLEEELSQLEDQLQVYEALDNQISIYRKQRKDSQEGYQSYLANISVAEQLQERRTRLDSISGQHSSTEEKLKEMKDTLNGAREAFDQARHTQVRAELIDTSKKVARLEAIIEESDKRFEQLDHDISELEEKNETLVSTENELASNEATGEALDFIRSTIRSAGPYVTRALVQTISLEANRIFGEIMNDHSLRLIWNDDYSITLEQAGEQRDFSQLSGGEKTAAALSVRLALLRELSRIRVAFFDEPTSNLDDQRRENLASQITKITGFNQLFVISHDDTFERETHHVIHVTKSHGASQVEVS